jgi:hypothetical protein
LVASPSVPSPVPASPPLFPRVRWAALLFLLVFTPSYGLVWGPRNFLHLCDVNVFLTVLALWRGSALLLSSQVVTSLVVNLLWVLDVIGRVALGQHFIGGTEYMFDDRFALFVRLLSLFHLGLPALHLWALGRTGYDRRGLALGCALVAVVFLISWLCSDPIENLNFVYRDPIGRHAFGPPFVHLVISFVGLVVIVFVPTHLLLLRLYRRRLIPPAPVPSR